LQRDLRDPRFSSQAAEGIARRIEELSAAIGQIERAGEAQFAEQNQQYQLRTRVVSLARARVLEFAGAADVQMAAAARIAGHCCICWRTLTDPVSLERGIGPECLQHRVKAALAFHGRGWTAGAIAEVIGMPVAFVETVIGPR
jgi:hypothetical protein